MNVTTCRRTLGPLRVTRRGDRMYIYGFVRPVHGIPVWPKLPKSRNLIGDVS